MLQRGTRVRGGSERRPDSNCSLLPNPAAPLSPQTPPPPSVKSGGSAAQRGVSMLVSVCAHTRAQPLCAAVRCCRHTLAASQPLLSPACQQLCSVCLPACPVNAETHDLARANCAPSAAPLSAPCCRAPQDPTAALCRQACCWPASGAWAAAAVVVARGACSSWRSVAAAAPAPAAATTRWPLRARLLHTQQLQRQLAAVPHSCCCRCGTACRSSSSSSGTACTPAAALAVGGIAGSLTAAAVAARTLTGKQAAVMAAHPLAGAAPKVAGAAAAAGGAAAAEVAAAAGAAVSVAAAATHAS